QVGTGDPLLQLVPGEAEDEPAGEPPRFDLLLAETAAAEDEPHARCRRTLDELRRLALGFDVDPSLAGSLGARWSAACAGAVDSEPILRGEREVLEIFADVCSLA